jgi:SAM-dependent methyltransferase
LQEFSVAENLSVRNLVNSIRRRVHSLLANPQRARKHWDRQYWQEIDGMHDVACRSCPKFSPAQQACTVPFGSPLRKCVAASIEAHLHNMKGKDTLDIGYGRWQFARNLITRGGGTWTGIDPGQDPAIGAVLGKGGYGHAEDIPFAEESFDTVFGIQTIVHWGQKTSDVREPSEYSDCLKEIWRVLKPGGNIYFDAPIHLHGHEMFMMGDTDRIRAIFDDSLWGDVVLERWRYDYEPLKRYPPTHVDIADWQAEISSYSLDDIAKFKNEQTVWLLTMSAKKIKL